MGRKEEGHPLFFNQAALFFCGPQEPPLNRLFPFLKRPVPVVWQEQLPACLQKALCSWLLPVPLGLPTCSVKQRNTVLCEGEALGETGPNMHSPVPGQLTRQGVPTLLGSTAAPMPWRSHLLT